VGENIMSDILFIISTSSDSICTTPLINYANLSFNFETWTIMTPLGEAFQTQTIAELLLPCEEDDDENVFVTEGGTGGMTFFFLFFFFFLYYLH
jgi:predicted transcriptional regulator